MPTAEIQFAGSNGADSVRVQYTGADGCCSGSSYYSGSEGFGQINDIVSLHFSFGVGGGRGELTLYDDNNVLIASAQLRGFQKAYKKVWSSPNPNAPRDYTQEFLILPTPEPATFGLLAASLGGLLAIKLRKVRTL